MICINVFFRRSAAPAAAAVALLALGGCAGLDRIKQIGEVPKMTKLEDPTTQPGYQPVAMPVPTDEPQTQANGSIWQAGARAFFKDHRASRVGDVLTVDVAINDSAVLNNQNQDTRKDSVTSTGANLLGLEKTPLARAVDLGSLVNTSGTLGVDGQAQVNRSEQINLTIAAIVTQVLPTGNLVILGSQEVRVNYDVRELQVEGIVRPTDIDSTNSVSYTKIAGARISYGGHGQNENLQQPRYGTQLYDAIAPF
jgi:flagellar L-ring protein precursor FlgH